MKSVKGSSSACWRGHPHRPDKVVDVHAHVGRCKGMRWLGTDDADEVLDRASAVGVDLSILSHLDALYWPNRYGRTANVKLLNTCEKRSNALMWWVVDPRSKSSCDLFHEYASHPKVVGMKIGPTYHEYPFVTMARTVLDLAEECDAAVLSHSGDPHDMPAGFVPWLNRYPRIKFIIAHFGNCQDFRGHEQALVRCHSSGCFVDTSSSVSMYSDHIERGVRRLGVRRFLFGTDSPLYSTAAQLGRILESELSPSQKKAVLGENARLRLLPKKINL